MRAVPAALAAAKVFLVERVEDSTPPDPVPIAAALKSVARFEGLTMNRIFLSEAGLALAMASILSCSANDVTGLDGSNPSAVTPEESVVASITVTLASSSIAAGQTTQVTADVYNRRGSEIDRVVQWASSNPSVATVSNTGLVQALAPGSASITATRRDVTGSATLTVLDGSGPPPPTGSSNEPSGMTLLSDRQFNAIDELGWDDGGGSGGAIIQDATAPRSQPNILRTTLPAGFRAGSGSYSGDFNFAASRTLYVAYWARVSSNWQGPDAGINKQFYVYTSTGEPSVVFAINGVNSDPLTPVVEGQDIIRGGAGHGDAQNPDWGPNLVPSARVPRGEWYQVEATIVGNTAGAADGSIDIYVNGVHVASYANIQFTSGAARWALFHYTNIWTGVAAVTRQAQTLDFDEIYLSGKN
jgi:hypothetical protein